MFIFKNKEIKLLKEQNQYLREKLNILESNESELKKAFEGLQDKMNNILSENEKLRDSLNELFWDEAQRKGLFDEPDEIDYSEPCSCGGVFTPMYDEHPNWIKYCTTCDSRTEGTEYSPIKEA
ncbi:hypothetical protein HRF87_05715 [Bacillus sp. CRN 9]|nr:hypothetical protein [Bacillus sp. CRN 9]